MNNKNIIPGLLILTVVLSLSLIYDKYSFPIKYKVCGVNYSDCFTTAKFDDFDSCEDARRRSSWYCDTVTNPTNPDCEIKESTISTSYCSE